jgi:hypothetical protein
LEMPDIHKRIVGGAKLVDFSTHRGRPLNPKLVYTV